MSGRLAAWLAWSLWGVQVLVVAALVWLGPLTVGAWGAAGSVVFILACATSGALVASRRPANPIGWLLSVAALAFSVGAVSVEYFEHAVRDGLADMPVARAAAWVGSFVWMIGVGAAATFLLLLFPDGRLPSRRWRPVAWVAGASWAVLVFGMALTPGPIEDTRVDNPVGLPGDATRTVLLTLADGAFVVLLASAFASVASLMLRFRASGREQRQQLAWIAYSLPILLVCLGASIWVDMTRSGEAAVEASNGLTAVGLAVVPVTICVAVLRHRLYDIDIVINRTLVYAALTVTLAVCYLGSVLLSGLLLSPLAEESDLAVALSTLAVAALFRPARSRIQGAVDRRFYRRRYDASQATAAFTGRLRHEVDLESVSAELRGVVRETVQPAHVSLWLRTSR